MDNEEATDAEGVRFLWNRTLPRRVWLRKGHEFWFLPDPEAALARIALDDDPAVTDPARWMRAKAREFVGRVVTPLPMPEDAVGFFTVGAERWFSAGWIH